ncbi:hypothetical protein Tco_0054349 [Tanacetum coccineum]
MPGKIFDIDLWWEMKRVIAAKAMVCVGKKNRERARETNGAITTAKADVLQDVTNLLEKSRKSCVFLIEGLAGNR